jgi:predicted alpha/beta hydrolase
MSPGTNLLSNAMPRVAAAQLETHWSRIFYVDLFAAEPARRLDSPPRGDERVSELHGTPTQDVQARARGTARGEPEQLTLHAADGYPIVALRYTPSQPAHTHLIVAGTIGVPQRFYRRFAEFAAAHGYSTLTLDYRGIGLSAPASLKGFRMDYFDWGRLDLAAAVAAMSTDRVPLCIVGHSFGGHAFGVLPQCERVTAFYTFGTGAGWHGWMPFLARIRVLALWHALGPLLTRWKGYLPWSLLGMGEDLPLDLYRRWKQWCRRPNYFFGDPRMRHLALDRVRAPLMPRTRLTIAGRPRSRATRSMGYWNAAFGRTMGSVAHRPARSVTWAISARRDRSGHGAAWLDAHRSAQDFRQLDG